MENTKVAMRYAKAIYPVAKSGGYVDAMRQDLERIVGLMKISTDFRLLMHSPIIPQHKKIKVFDEIFKDKISKETEMFMKLIFEKNREMLVGSIYKCFINLYNIENGIIDCQVYSATELLPAAKDKLNAFVQNATQMKPSPEYLIDKTAIGGVKLKIHDVVYDATIKTKLAELHRSLVE
jgi:F-type H+-transporting ATPase subunit delta